MNNLNNVVIEGRLVRDASEGYRTGKNGTPYGEFTIAVNESRKVGDEWKEETSFIDCHGFGKGYDYAVPRMTKGSVVRIVGKLKQERWETDGQKRSKLTVECERYFTQAPGGGQQEEAPRASAPEPQSPGFAEDIPF